MKRKAKQSCGIVGKRAKITPCSTIAPIRTLPTDILKIILSSFQDNVWSLQVAMVCKGWYGLIKIPAPSMDSYFEKLKVHSKHDHRTILEWMNIVPNRNGMYYGIMCVAAQHGNLGLLDWCVEKGYDGMCSGIPAQIAYHGSLGGHWKVIEWVLNYGYRLQVKWYNLNPLGGAAGTGALVSFD